MAEKDQRFAEARIIGSAISNLGEIMRPFIKKNDPLLAVLDSIDAVKDADSYYPVQIFVDLLKLAEEHGVITKLAENRALGTLRILMGQAGIQTPRDVLLFLGSTVGNHHQGDVGSWSVTIKDKRSAEVEDTTYLPCSFTIPMLVKTLIGFGAKNVKYGHDPERCRKNGAASCLYTFDWEESDLLKLRSI